MSEPDFRHLPTWLLSAAAHRAHRLVHDRLAQAGAGGYEYRVLSALAAAGEATQADIGRLAQLDRRDVTTTVRALADLGLVVRRRSADDARARIVSLTPAGRRRYAELRKVVADIQEELLKPLAPGHRDRLLGDLAALARRPAPNPRDPEGDQGGGRTRP
ncbi:MAG TPA: MarR family winged helix-turn-helix transcriptional regulator [Solirubrobacteraceae bacterium]|nr:MarR family winged helix-turn-helix transcriptional regulator [Solirubrobacteraceae bacterium]